MRLYMVRRTRSFIKDHYAQEDEVGKRYLQYQDGSRAYFPTRIPRTAKFEIGSAGLSRAGRRFKWIRSSAFTKQLGKDLLADTDYLFIGSILYTLKNLTFLND